MLKYLGKQGNRYPPGRASVGKNPKCLQADSEDPDPYADVQADLKLCWAYIQYCRKCCALAHMRTYAFRAYANHAI